VPEQVDAFPKAQRANETWDSLTDGSVWKLSPADLKVYASAKSAIASVRHYARTRGFKVKTMEHDGDLYVQFTKPAEGDELEARRQRD
jgi:hypothetical protein